MASWTFLIYAAGNTELEPEIYQAFKLLTEIRPLVGTNIIVQIARAPIGLLRRFGKLAQYQGEDDWSGVRRYLIQASGCYLIQKLPDTNMAKPETLHDFLLWAETNYPSDRTALILSGHSSGFIGVMMDYDKTGGLSLMSVTGLARVLAAVYLQTGRQLDLLILDTCFANMVEVWHELALIGGQSVKNLTVPIGSLRCEGLPCHFMIDKLQKSDPAQPLPSIFDLLAQNIREQHGLNSSVLFIKLEANLLIELKSEIDKIAAVLLANRAALAVEFAACHADWDSDTVSLLYLENWLHCFFSRALPAPHVLASPLSKLVLAPQLSSLPASFRYGPSLLVTSPERYQLLEPYYNRMQFAEGNRWSQTLLGRVSESDVKREAPPDTVAVPEAVEAEFRWRHREFKEV